MRHTCVNDLKTHGPAIILHSSNVCQWVASPEKIAVNSVTLAQPKDAERWPNQAKSKKRKPRTPGIAREKMKPTGRCTRSRVVVYTSPYPKRSPLDHGRVPKPAQGGSFRLSQQRAASSELRLPRLEVFAHQNQKIRSHWPLSSSSWANIVGRSTSC